MRRLSCARTRFSLTSLGLLERFPDGILGDFVEDDAADRDLGLEHLREVPADRLAFAVRVGGEQHFGRVLERVLQVRDLLLLVAGDDVVRREVAVDVDAQPAPVLLLDLLGDFGGRFRQIADVAVARLDAVLRAEEAAERLRLRGRFDDHQRFCAAMLSQVVVPCQSVVTLTRSYLPPETAAPDALHVPRSSSSSKRGSSRVPVNAGRRGQRVEIVGLVPLHHLQQRIPGSACGTAT